MSFIFKEIIRNRLRNLSVEELLHYGKQYGFSISREEATHILHFIRTSNFDIFSKQAIDEAYDKIADITNTQTANKAKALFENLIKSYGLEDYFN